MNELDKQLRLTHSQLIIDSLLDSCLLVENLGGIVNFDRTWLTSEQGKGSCSSIQITEPLNFEQKLGHLYEDALELVFQASGQFKQVLRSVAIREPHTPPQKGIHTLGELDYLLETKEGSWLHIELAVKFYLAIDENGVQSWPGPDARDSWERKRQHMINHQFSLLEHPATQQKLAEICGGDDGNNKNIQNQTVTSHHLIYGCLFDKVDSNQLQKTAPNPQLQQPAQDTATTAHRGLWMHSRELTSSKLANQKLWLIPKHLWPCSPTVKLTQALNTITIEGIQQLIEQQQRCVMITDGSGRYFIAPNHYPEVKPL